MPTSSVFGGGEWRMENGERRKEMGEATENDGSQDIFSANTVKLDIKDVYMDYPLLLTEELDILNKNESDQLASFGGDNQKAIPEEGEGFFKANDKRKAAHTWTWQKEFKSHYFLPLLPCCKTDPPTIRTFVSIEFIHTCLANLQSKS
ncbi:hypothetical protein SDJN03_06713, partial [Cucurbita argyrosperma subsp. sororia]